jgi:hypothetical protein
MKLKPITLALLLGTGLTVSLVGPAPRAEASAIQTIDPQTVSAATFTADFTPYNTASLSPFQFDGSSTSSGLVESQVFQGTGAYAGLYAYAYQLAVNPTTASGEPVHVDSASLTFGATPIGADLAGTGHTAYGFVIPNGQVGGLNLSGTQVPSTLSWQPGQTTGFIRSQYVDPATQTQALAAGTTSATFVLLSTQPPSSTPPSVNIGGPAATTTVPVAYSAAGGTISPIPAPEPASLLAWAGVAGALAVVRRHRKARAAQA